MERRDAPVGLIRGLATLRRARAQGVLQVATPRAMARLSIVNGLPVAVHMPESRGDSLGDLLIREGALNRRAHERAFAAIPPRGPVGPWLARVGATDAPALAYVCRRQLRDRLQGLLLAPAQRMRFLPGDSDVGVPTLKEPAPLGALLLGTLRQLASPLEADRWWRRQRGQSLVLTPTGEAMIEGAALWPAEQAMLTPLRAGASTDTLVSVSANSARALRTLHGLWQARGVTSTRGRAYRLLMRKRRELRSAVGGRRLLDLPRQAGPLEARRALRKLARSLHPDRFHDAPLRGASEEVFSALVRAADEIGA